MYSLFCRNINGLANYIGNDSVRLKSAEPLFLLGNKVEFENEKNAHTQKYLNLCEIIKSAENLKHMVRYRKFDTFLRELSNLDFDLQSSENDDETFSREMLLEQIELLRQCMFFTYVH